MCLLFSLPTAAEADFPILFFLVERCCARSSPSSFFFSGEQYGTVFVDFSALCRTPYSWILFLPPPALAISSDSFLLRLVQDFPPLPSFPNRSTDELLLFARWASDGRSASPFSFCPLSKARKAIPLSPFASLLPPKKIFSGFP